MTSHEFIEKYKTTKEIFTRTQIYLQIHINTLYLSLNQKYIFGRMIKWLYHRDNYGEVIQKCRDIAKVIGITKEINSSNCIVI